MADDVAKPDIDSEVDDGPAALLLGQSSIAAADAVTSETEGATMTADDEAAPDDELAAAAGAASVDAEQADAETDLLSALAKAMHEAAAARRTQALKAVEDRRAAYIQTIRDRGSAQALDVRAEADQDMVGINTWADAEMERIKSERERRSAARKRELDALLDRHAAQLEWEIESVEGVVAGHRTDLETFFGRLDSESDVTTLARLAQDVPEMPDLESISADVQAGAEATRSGTVHPARATFAGTGAPPSASGTAPVSASGYADEDLDEEVDEDRLIGVMDPAARRAPSVMEMQPVGTEPDPAPEAEESRPLEPVAAERASSGQLLQAISALRPSTSWLRPGNGSARDEKHTD